MLSYTSSHDASRDGEKWWGWGGNRENKIYMARSISVLMKQKSVFIYAYVLLLLARSKNSRDLLFCMFQLGWEAWLLFLLYLYVCMHKRGAKRVNGRRWAPVKCAQVCSWGPPPQLVDINGCCNFTRWCRE